MNGIIDTINDSDAFIREGIRTQPVEPDQEEETKDYEPIEGEKCE